jgi:phosphonopyruvate decarboxylase
MLHSSELVDFFLKKGVDLFAGVPDSLLSEFSACLDSSHNVAKHIIAANEGNACALAIGHYLGTGRSPVVYLQNSGLGNLVNPLLSLSHKLIYGIPIFFVVGWRGCPGKSDEPQHIKQGRATTELLKLCDIPFWTLSTSGNPIITLESAWAEMESTRESVCILIREGDLLPEKATPFSDHPKSEMKMSREDAIRRVVELSAPDDIFIATTGKTGRELYEIRVDRNEPTSDFLTVGGMGHCSMIGLGVALQNPRRRVICLDGDGAAIMHMGALSTIGTLKPRNLIHIILNNKSHDSVGGQPTVAGKISLSDIARTCGYPAVYSVLDSAGLDDAWDNCSRREDLALLEISIDPGARQNLGRPKSSPQINKNLFMTKLGIRTRQVEDC